MNTFTVTSCEGQPDTRTIQLENWSNKTGCVDYPKQDDGYNCGVFVLYYMQQIIECGISPGQVFNNVNIFDFRKQCQSLLYGEMSITNNSTSSLAGPPVAEGPQQENQSLQRANDTPKKFDNGLMQLPEYYCSPLDDNNTDFTVCSIKEMKQIGNIERQLPKSGYLHLFDNKTWFSNCLLDYCNATFVKPCQFYVSVSESNTILYNIRKITPSFKLLSIHITTLTLIFIPCNSGSHYSLFVIDLRSKTVCYLDPFEINTRNSLNIWSKIKQFFFFSKRNHILKDDAIDVDNYKLVTVDYPLQQDSSNCGAYVVYYVSVLSEINKIAEISTVNPSMSRRELQLRWLQHSLNMVNRCLYCGGKQSKSHDVWCQCSSCLRWVHYKCLKMEIPFEEIQSPSFILTCSLCKSWLEKQKN